MNTYDYLIVLCPGIVNDKGQFDEIDSNGLYLGGQVRMQAAAALHTDPTVEIGKYIIVGGGMEKTNITKRQEKVDCMCSFLKNKGVPKETIVRVVSGADTSGNFRALWKVFRSELQQKRIGILTNFYHMPRVMRIAQDAQFDWQVSFVPICAEAIRPAEPPLDHIPGLSARIATEIKGLGDWERGEYRDQHKPVIEWEGELLPD
ncbi:MAG TPA: YdcF family protein [Patescibacteria group bacterium]|nr:YdcF family protein [Patescibacteria group bacterium]